MPPPWQKVATAVDMIIRHVEDLDDPDSIGWDEAVRLAYALQICGALDALVKLAALVDKVAPPLD